MQFAEDEDGQMIDGHRASAIRHHARAIFNDIATWTTPPGTWGAASSVMRSYYHNRCMLAFPKCGTVILTGKPRDRVGGLHALETSGATCQT